MTPAMCLVNGSSLISFAPYNIYTKHSSSLPLLSLDRVSTAATKLQSLSTSHQEKKHLTLRGGSSSPCHEASTSFRGISRNVIPFLPGHCNPQPRSSIICGASKNMFIYPVLTTKPKWWWRTLACVPYLLPLHNAWSYADAVYHLHPVMEGLDFLANPFLDTIALLPGWLVLVLFMGIYFLVVRRKEWPHFLRFHVIMAMLLDTGFQVMATACTWLPNAVYRGKLMTFFWMTVAFAQIYTVVESMRCALAGMYLDAPFLSEAAYIHSDSNLLN